MGNYNCQECITKEVNIINELLLDTNLLSPEEASIEETRTYESKIKPKKINKLKPKEEDIKKSSSKSKGKTKKSTKKSQKSDTGLKRPQTPYFLFCSKQREELKKKGDDKKLTAKELGAMWKKLSETKKKPFVEQYELEKKKYEKMKDELENKSDSESEEEKEEKKPKRKASKAKAKTKKSQNDKNNCKACNCGECDECMKGKKKKGKKAVADDDDEDDD